ncbi:MAG: tRNA (adenosine(37)-N6)-dimethylallyltransferase MiaA [Bacteroidetes bacterium SW_11_45_7]|nr:MAG: tRNA (adenosine(37)-N6)-dimethylallyltransferase MiaA [Bacteroidetes bacterium SW_11_45_7]
MSTSSSPPLLIVITGPTATGKTGVAVELAKRFNTSILSADSRQFYKEMSIGTAKPTQDEMEGIPHYFIGFLSIKEKYDVGQFEKDALHRLNKIFQSNDTAIAVGGSGLFIKAVTEGLDPLPRVDPSIREELNALYANYGIDSLQEELREKDPAYYKQVDLSNPHRLIRALEVMRGTGTPFSAYRKGHQQPRSFNVLKLGISLARNILYDRINKRVDKMVENGLLEEVKQLQDCQQYQALQTVGYRELFDYLNGKLDLETAVQLIKTHTRQYAKRQLTWFRREEDIHWFKPSAIEEMMSTIDKYKKW